jgi:uncharacterized protein with FMN-binding domain
MKINRFIALAAIALLVVSAMGAISLKAFAKGAAAPAAQITVQIADCSQDQADGTEVKSTTDADNVELQCGDQVEDGLPDSAAAPAQGSSSASVIPASASLVIAQAAPLNSAANTTVSSTTGQDNQQIEDGLPDSAETIGAADTDNVQLEEQVGDQNTQDTGVEAPEVEAPAVP